MLRALVAGLLCAATVAGQQPKLPTHAEPSKWIMWGEPDETWDKPPKAVASDRGFMAALQKEQSTWSCENRENQKCDYIANAFHWGSLGTAVMVVELSDECGKSNCSFHLFYKTGNVWHRDDTFGGQGFAVVPNGTPVPDIADTGLVGGQETVTNFYRFKNGKFVRFACNDDEGDDSPPHPC